MKIIAFLSVVVILTALVLSVFSSKSEAAYEGTAHQFTFVDIDGNSMMMEDFKGKVVMVVNVASQCGFADQYTNLQALYEKYKERGLVIVAVPSNDFGGQEPGTEAEIKANVSKKYGVTFPMTQKYAVSGKEAHPFYKWAADQDKGGLIFSRPRWNFHKYVVAPDGTLAASFGSQTRPDTEKVIEVIEENLPPEESQ